MTSPHSDGAMHDIHEETRRKEENDKISRILRPYATFLVKYPSVVLGLVTLVVTLSVVLGFVSSAGAKDLPDFSKPTKGFAARGTTISLRLTAYDNLLLATGHPSLRNKRSLDFRNDIRKEIVLIYQHVSEGDLTSHMKAVCMLHKQIILDTPNSQQYLETTTHHIPNYIAYLNNRGSCSNITNDDISNFFDLLRNCRIYYNNNMFEKCRKDINQCTSINATCRTHLTVTDPQEMAGLFYNTFFYLTDSNFIGNPQVLKFTSSINQIKLYHVDIDKDFFEPLYNNYLKDLADSEASSVKVAAFHLYDFKFYVFQSEIIVQSLFIVTAIIIVILFIWFYSGSIFVGLMTFVCVIIATIITYFVYGRVFDMKFFPFLNMVTTIFLVGIGADDAFVYMGIWEEAKKIYAFRKDSNHDDYLIKWTIHSLRHALLAMFVTSLTTASAFYANISSNVTSVKCFGLFSGTAIIVNYLLMIVFFPVVVVLHDKYLSKCMHFCCPKHCKTRPIVNPDDDHNNSQYFQANGDLELQQVPVVDVKPNNLTKKIQSTLEAVSDGLFKIYIPAAVMRGRFAWIVCILAFGIAGIVITFITPGLRPPSTGDFQMFSSSNSLEQYDLNYKKKFLFGLSSSGGNRGAAFVFGVKEIDNGYRFDPDDSGSLEYHNSVLGASDEQVWLRDFCMSIKNASFYVSSTTCDDLLNKFAIFTSPCTLAQTTCCNYTFPMPKNDFDKCLNQNRPATALFDGKGHLKAFHLDMETSYKYSEGFDENENLFNEMDSWFQKHAQNIKSSAFQGFWFIEQGFYDLQKSLSEGTKESLAISIAVAFCVILITTGNIILSIYSILTIAFIISVTVGVLILAGWRLNIMESVVFSVAAGLSADFTLHYSVAYKTSLIKNDRVKRVKGTILEIGPAILMGAVTTFIAGVAMVPSSVLVYIQMAQFLMLVMFVSWFIGTFFFLSLCAVIGPVGNFGQIRCPSKNGNNSPEPAVNNVHSNAVEKENVENVKDETSSKSNDTPDKKQAVDGDTAM